MVKRAEFLDDKIELLSLTFSNVVCCRKCFFEGFYNAFLYFNAISVGCTETPILWKEDGNCSWLIIPFSSNIFLYNNSFDSGSMRQFDLKIISSTILSFHNIHDYYEYHIYNYDDIRVVFDPSSVCGCFERLNNRSSRHSFSIEEIVRTHHLNRCHTGMKDPLRSHDISWSRTEYMPYSRS